MSQAIITGWMKKEGGFIKSWKKRYFELIGHTLSYYTNPKGELKGTIELTPNTVVDKDPKCKFQPAISISTVGQDRVYKLVCEDENQRQKWIETIQSVISSMGCVMGSSPNSGTKESEVFIPNEDDILLKRGKPAASKSKNARSKTVIAPGAQSKRRPPTRPMRVPKEI